MLESDEIHDLIDPDEEDVLHYSELRHAYEITPSFRKAQIVRDAGFQNEGRIGRRYYTHSESTVRRIPEWELLADPDTYARLKTGL